MMARIPKPAPIPAFVPAVRPDLPGRGAASPTAEKVALKDVGVLVIVALGTGLTVAS